MEYAGFIMIVQFTIKNPLKVWCSKLHNNAQVSGLNTVQKAGFSVMLCLFCKTANAKLMLHKHVKSLTFAGWMNVLRLFYYGAAQICHY